MMIEDTVQYGFERPSYENERSETINVCPTNGNPQQSLHTHLTNALDHGQTLEAPSQDASAVPSTSTERMAKLLKDKRGQLTTVMEKMGTLQLLDLPIDILREIIKEVTHTNDLTSLALTHSALYMIAIPHIYSRFDIVWPEGPNSGESRSGVDALTYGLSTLVMSERIFGESAAFNPEKTNHFCHNCGTMNPRRARYQKYGCTRQCRRGNSYGQYTRKFSLGNGPSNWVQEYLISKESGKMLGTLVALAVSQMNRLETFIWDMPTGVLREVWAALSLVEDQLDGPTSRLEKIWIRWHNNKSIINPSTAQGSGNLIQSTSLPTPPPLGPPIHVVSSQMNSMAIGDSSSSQRTETLLEKSYRNIEHPNFSILPPLKSINVLDIDEPAYLEELSILVERSIDRLRELRIGAASISIAKSWLRDNTTDSTTSDCRVSFLESGGMLGMIMSRFYDCRRRTHPSNPTVQENRPHTQEAESGTRGDIGTMPGPELGPAELRDDMFAANFSGPLRSKLLRLTVLELERVPICVSVLQKTVDWSVLTSLTLLNCESDEEFWKALRRTYSLRRKSPQSDNLSTNPADYRLKLKRIHTNNVSPALISFLKEALAPNSLEWMFLQDGGHPISKVTVDTIYRGPLRRHRSSLKKLMIDSSERRLGGNSSNHKWKKWMLNREILSFITSGKMPFLRELALVIDYKDWHFFLQRLPQIPHVRSLYIPHIADSPYGSPHDVRELALQLVDIVTLVPAIELCYLGISTKCYEILENRQNDDLMFSVYDPLTTSANGESSEHVLGDQDEDSDVDDDDNDDDDDDEDDAAAAPSSIDHGNNDSDAAEDSDTSSDNGSGPESGGKQTKLKLREILFYDDKVSIFKARHGQL